MNFENLTIVITTFHSHDKIFKCLNSINPEISVIIVENSNDQLFKDSIEKKYKNVKCILSKENLGYAKGNNVGLSYVSTKYALILNPDVVIEKNTLNNFFLIVENIPDFAILAPEIQEEENYSNENINDISKLTEVKKVKGFAMFLNLAQFNHIGFFDDNFFIYLEETDLCKRLINDNKKIFLHSDLRFHHLGGSSHNKSINFEMELSRNWHWMWSTFYFYKKHYGFLYALFKVSGKLTSSLIKMLIYLAIFNTKKEKYTLTDFLD